MSSSASPLTGGCACGAVRFTVSEPFVSAVYCHCTRCQRRTGTGAAATALIAPGSLTVLSGADALGRWAPGDGFTKVFCAQCGSAVFVEDPRKGVIRGVRLGAVDGDPGIRPQARQYVAYAAAWEPIPDDGLPRHPEGRPRATPRT
jgi:hypothetical protein